MRSGGRERSEGGGGSRNQREIIFLPFYFKKIGFYSNSGLHGSRDKEREGEERGMEGEKRMRREREV